MIRLNKKAVSPVVGVILLIGLVVTAGAMLALVVLPMISNDTLESSSILTDLDERQLTISNSHVFEITIVDVAIDGIDYPTDTAIGAGKAAIIILAVEPDSSLILTISGKGQTITVTVAI